MQSSTERLDYGIKLQSLERAEWIRCGPDDIIPTLVKEGMDALSLYIRNIYGACLVYAYIKIGWRDVKVILIPQTGKPTYGS